jgi:predicted transcriptional regulator of viral defense system
VKPELLSQPELVVFTTREFARRAEIEVASASRHLASAARRGAIVRLTRGLWANASHPYFHPLACVPKLLGNEQGYVSFLSALHLRGAIDQIPRAVQIATTGHARKLSTAVGTYEFFRLAPSMMRDGIEWSDTRVPYRVATTEKALLDAFYISIRRGRRFRSLPEIDWSRISRRRFSTLLGAVGDARATAAIGARFHEVWRRG